MGRAVRNARRPARADFGTGARAAFLPHGRLHLNHGPIDLVIEANGTPKARQDAFDRARRSFLTILTDLMAEIELLRAPARCVGKDAKGPVAHRMLAATRVVGDIFVTPMAAVAGAVADHVLAEMTRAAQLDFALVNNGGDIAFWQGMRPLVRIGIVSDPQTANQPAVARVPRSSGIGGVATSGWRGRSFSLGIADAVTVLAENAACADVAATLIANAVDLPESVKIKRTPACDLAPDNDLGNRPVTVAVAALTNDEVGRALDLGERRARTFIDRGLGIGVCLNLQGHVRVVGRGFSKTPEYTQLKKELRP